jgi:hypothetical protein
MGERAHTPGPWFVCGDAGFRSQNASWREGLTIGSASEGTRVCDVTTLRLREHALVDARLIAAAPDMFEALLTALPYIECAEEDDAYKQGVVAKVTAQIRASLAKAGLGQRADATSFHPATSTREDQPSSPQESGR